MGFAKNLGKGFVRSAVNQVGRDYGRTISNDVFGDRHAIPHRSVNNYGQPVYIQQPTQTQNELPPTLPEGGYFDVTPKFVLWIFGSLFIPFFVGIAAFFVGLFNYYNKDVVDYVYYVDEPTFVPDGRYRGGVRYNGDIPVKKTLHLPAHTVFQPIVEQQRRNGWRLMIIGGIISALWLLLFGVAQNG